VASLGAYVKQLFSAFGPGSDIEPYVGVGFVVECPNCWREVAFFTTIHIYIYIDIYIYNNSLYIYIYKSFYIAIHKLSKISTLASII